MRSGLYLLVLLCPGVRPQTCCSQQRKCCQQTWAPLLSLECQETNEACCDMQCSQEQHALLQEVFTAPLVPIKVRNDHGLVLSATCCDLFFDHGGLCRSDLGDDCSGARRCRRFGADCASCESYCAKLAPR